METIETFIILILAIISLPSLCKFLNRPALLYSSYLIVGLLIGELIAPSTKLLLHELGKIGFILLLFIIGLEIEIPKFKILKQIIPFCITWLIVQMPLLLIITWIFGLELKFGFVAVAGINACSLGISYGLVQSTAQAFEEHIRKKIIFQMVFLEIASIFFFTASDAIYSHGWGKEILLQGLLLIAFIIVIRISSGLIHRYLTKLIESTRKWRIHQFFLIILSVSVIGQKFGLSAPKTAFFLGLFMSGVTHEGIKFEDQLKPIAQRILIPIFFLGLGTKISLPTLFPWILPSATLFVATLLFIRFWLFKLTSSLALPAKYFLLYCPNITMVAVAAEMLFHHDASKEHIDLLLVIGLLMSIIPVIFFPATSKRQLESYRNIEDKNELAGLKSI